MNDALAFPAIPAENVLSDRFRIHAVMSDAMEPTLRGNRDYALIAPVQSYQGEGIYLIDNGFGGDLVRVTNVLTGLCVSKDNPLYRHNVVVDREKFNEAVLGIVVADIKPRDERFLREACQ